MNLFKKKTDPSGEAPEAAAPKRRTSKPAPAKERRTSKPPKRPPLQQPHQLSPFLAEHTQAGLADRFAELNKRRSDWVLIALCLALCLALSLGMNLYQATEAEVIPFKVVVDGTTGYLLEKGELEPITAVDDVLLQRELREVITGLRTVLSDEAATAKQFNHAYGHVLQGSPADAFLKDFFLSPGNHPLELAGSAQRTVVEFVGPTPLAGGRTWSVQWSERTARGGKSVTEDFYRGSISTKVMAVRSLEAAQRNPLGVWIDGLEWERVQTKIIDISNLEDLTPIDFLYPTGRQLPQTSGPR